MISSPTGSRAAVPADDRRDQILRAALSVISGRGFAETRIADVADEAGVSPALVIYYFKTKDRLLTEATRYAEEVWYAGAERRVRTLPTASERLEQVVRLCSHGDPDDEIVDAWAIWIDLWAQALRNPEVARGREEFDVNWRRAIRSIIEDGLVTGEFCVEDVETCVLTLCSLIDGLTIQIALGDPVVDADRAFEISMRYAAAMLGLGVRDQTGGCP